MVGLREASGGGKKEMERERLEEKWRELAEEVITGVRDWRAAHPKATFREIEEAVDARMDRMRAKLLEEAAMASKARDMSGTGEARAHCPSCGHELEGRGERERGVTVRGNQTVKLKRRYAVCPACGAGLFPPG
jgi:hypothetical protein